MAEKNKWGPYDITLKVLKNKVYILEYKQHESEHRKILTKAMAIRMANDFNVRREIRDVIIEAFKEGVIA
jgi:hypothetical protein